jgi:predicted MFS family arabinose efflux permease
MIAQYVAVPTPSPGGQKTAVVALMFFVFFYGLFIDAASFIYSSEIYPTQIRARGVAMATATYFIACITYVTPGATAIARIGWRYFLVFVCLTVVTILVIYFMYPETKGRSLEELAELFGDRVVVHVTNATEEERARIEQEIKSEVVMSEHAQAEKRA